ncbi:sodium bile acid cotransporter [Artemisia annua]|uniref:Sodium bile acid cotransporter n=1 Tax=Artemisia annua TaxID=35608 RepID=A0A2U1Q4G3_ARTAN|nr:sodium bile acid cotransporter [Artemisia annua]
MGKVFRVYLKGVAYIVDSNRKLFAALGSILLSLIPWVQVSRSRPLHLMVNPEVVLVAVIMGVNLSNKWYQSSGSPIEGCYDDQETWAARWCDFKKIFFEEKRLKRVP